MKIIFSAVCILASINLSAQRDTIKSGVYNAGSYSSTSRNAEGMEDILHGSGKDIVRLDAYTTSFRSSTLPSHEQAHSDFDELVIVRNGELKMVINGKEKNLGQGGMAIITAADEHRFMNTSGNGVTIYLLQFHPKKNAAIHGAGTSIMKDWKELEVKKTDKGESRPIFDIATPMFTKFDMHATSLNSGFASHDPHRHRAEEIILMIKGDVKMLVGESFYDAHPGDLIFLTSNILHALINTGKEQCSYFAIQWVNPDEQLKQ